MMLLAPRIHPPSFHPPKLASDARDVSTPPSPPTEKELSKPPPTAMRFDPQVIVNEVAVPTLADGADVGANPASTQTA